MSMFKTEHTSIDACFMTYKRVLWSGFHFCEFGIESLTKGLNNNNNKKRWKLNAINIINSNNKSKSMVNNRKTTKCLEDRNTEKVSRRKDRCLFKGNIKVKLKKHKV